MSGAGRHGDGRENGLGLQDSGNEPPNNGLFGKRHMKPSAPPLTAPQWPGLCSSCRHAHAIETTRSVFWRCRMSETDARFPRYPALPVVACAGHEPMEPEPP